MSSLVESADPRVWLEGVSWEVYLYLRQLQENRNVRMTYDEGSLELMSPSKLHERIAELMGRMIAVWTEERGIRIQGCGAVTFQRQPKGLEPDRCYYIQNEKAVRRHDELDLERDPPPDLVVEIDVTSPSRSRLPIYAALGVPEVWWWRSEALKFFRLEGGEYLERENSGALPGFPRQAAEALLAERRECDDTALTQRFRQQVRAGE